METIDCIVRDMRECAADCTAHGCRDMERFADRIEAAYKRNRAYQESKCAANEELARKLTKQRDINKELVDDNARLKAALKPVLKCKKIYKPCPGQPEVMSLQWTAEPEAAIAEARRIYNEGAKHEGR